MESRCSCGADGSATESKNELSACCTPIRSAWPYGPPIGRAYSGILALISAMMSRARSGSSGRMIAASCDGRMTGGLPTRLCAAAPADAAIT